MIIYKQQPVAYVLFSIVLAVVATFGVIKTWNAYTEHAFIGKPDTVRDTITIDGAGKVTGKPTLALVQFGVVTQSPTPGKAQTDNTNKMNAVIQAMKNLGINADDLTTSGYSLSPVYDYSKSPYVIQGYSVNQALAIKVRDFDKIGSVLEQGVSLGINQVSDVNFTIDHPESLRDEARIKALEDSKKKASELAKALGVQIVRVVSFSETTPYTPGPVMYDRAMGVAAAAPANRGRKTST